ncbi:MAG: acetolactate synthase small subunit [Flavobacteriaceae bacterium]|jgi:acetolactate synthase-1/3 small subunit|nr:acetolactate synthase small subunit [Flavobacteriaceae bacterium]MBT7676074.1 acetolactate synthase small subunit [Flavobacteriaceae bacterium]MDA7570619.1 acetolactate synthase small subunit [Flavobacteriaceae bacterium]MDA8849495.1 acetolactate synthase small subunit [Flavobacteriaceae bacterium]MDA9630712.1 acetolactate synthase small subunit [Flavobacteriaceae bacterium]|tara:strand:- start:1633 stop:2163 length:531 start_codon:yes stop_codon:yes gene_type:complete
MEKKTYTISVYSENNVGLLNRISAIFLKRHINLESFSTSESEIPNVFRFVIVINITPDKVHKIVQQIEKQIDVIKAYYHTDEETIFQENALYKVKSSFLFEERQIQNIIKASHATIVTVSPEFFVIEKTGFREETEQLRKDLSPFGLLQFVRSGRISVTKAKMGISEILNTFKNNN